jgi:hypothetical protein
MAGGTSPSITALPGGSEYEIAFKANTDVLYTYHSNATGSFDTNVGLAAGTNPSIAG